LVVHDFAKLFHYLFHPDIKTILYTTIHNCLEPGTHSYNWVNWSNTDWMNLAKERLESNLSFWWGQVVSSHCTRTHVVSQCLLTPHPPGLHHKF